MSTRFLRGTTAVAGLALALTWLPAAATATQARASLLDIENEVMCVVCNEPLAVSQSPQAYRERALIKKLIAQGETKAQIERQLVAQYGTGVLGRPPARGFSLTVYILPPAIVLAGVLILVFTLPRWRRRAKATRSRSLPAGPALDPAESRRLDEELSHYGG
jgi:cytochrome c-type biogenesis protein CcmH